MKKATLSLLSGLAMLVAPSAMLAETVAYWKFNEGTGQNLVSSGNASGLTLQRGTSQTAYADPEWVVKDGRTALQFSNTGTPSFQVATMITPANGTALALSAFTVETFINLNTLPAAGFSATSPYTVLQLTNVNEAGQVGSINYGLRIVTNDVGGTSVSTLDFYYTNVSSGVTTLKHTTALSVDNWHYIGVSRDSSGLISLYIDHEVVTLVGSPDPAALLDPFLSVGAARISSGYNRGLDGSISEVRISDRALDSSELLINIPEPSEVGAVLAAMALAGAWLLRRRARG